MQASAPTFSDVYKRQRYVRFKMIVTAENCKREDKEFWIEKAPDDKTYKLELLAE